MLKNRIFFSLILILLLSMACITVKEVPKEVVPTPLSRQHGLHRGYYKVTQGETLYREPDLGSQKISRIEPGSIVEVVDGAGAFAQVKISENAVWVKRNQTEETSVHNVVRTLGTVRSKEAPSDASPDMDILESGKLLTVKTTSGNWLLVVISENRGWILSGAIEPIGITSKIQPTYESTEAPVTEEPTSVSANRWKVVKRANFRNAPTVNSRILATLEPGERIEYISKSGDWVKLRYDDKTGYIHESLVAPE